MRYLRIKRHKTISDATLTVLMSDAEVASIEGVYMEGGEYNGKPYAYTGTPVFKKSDGVPISNLSVEIIYGSEDGSYLSVDAPVDAGSYTLSIHTKGVAAGYIANKTYNYDITFNTKAELNDTIGKNYKLVHKNGILTVKEVNGTDQSKDDGNQPQIGDSSNYIWWILSMLGCATIIVTAVARRFKMR